MAAPKTPYAAITWGQAQADLLLRLNSTGADFWTTAEIQLYLTEALRVWNALTATYVQDWTVTLDGGSQVWQSTANNLNAYVGDNPTSPRYQTVNSNNLFTLVEYHLLEPPSGGIWNGTPQYSITDLAQALKRRLDFILQQTACAVGPMPGLSVPPTTYRVYLPDTPDLNILDVRRVRFLPEPTLGSPITLYREDGLAIEYFENDFTISKGDSPFAYDLISGPPLAITLDVPANLPNTLDILAIDGRGQITPPTAFPLAIPDDWTWVLKYGMLADLFKLSPESTDLERSDYCEKRFQEGVKLMQELPWLLQARINNIPVDTPSVVEMDEFSYEWQTDVNAMGAVVRGGVDLFAISPQLPNSNGFGSGGFGAGGFGGGGGAAINVNLSLVANMPIPATNAEYLQISRDVYDAILDYAQHISILKMGGFEFAESTRTLYKNFVEVAVNTNARLRESGIFASTLRPANSKQDAASPRFAAATGD